MKKTYYLIILIITTIVSYGASIHYGFSQDDWYFLYISQASNFKEVINFFNPTTQSGFAFFRPLSTQFYYYLFVKLFTLSQATYYMHVFMLIIQLLTAYLAQSLLVAIKVKQTPAQLISILYVGASSLFLSMFYIAATQQLLATFFSIIAILSSLKNKNIYAGMFWALALLSKETAIVTPLILLVLQYFYLAKKRFVDLFKSVLPYILVGSVYLILRLVAPPTIQSEYHLAFGRNVLSTIRWYLLFGFGSPEELMRYATNQGAVDIVKFIRDFGYLGALNIFSTILILMWFLYQLIINFRESKTWILLTWFVIGLLPVLFLQNHRYPHYLDLSLLPLLLILISGSKKAQYLITSILFLATFSAIQISIRSHWTTARSEISARARSYFETQKLCQHPAIAFVAPNTESAELSYALSLENGPRVICQNTALRVEYKTDSTGLEGWYLLDPRVILNKSTL